MSFYREPSYYEPSADTQHYHYIRHKTKPSVPLHFHSAIECLLVRRGRMLACVKGERYEIGAGEGCFVDRFCPHSFSDLAEETEIYVFVGSHTLVEPILTELGGIPPTVFPFTDFPFLDEALSRYEREEKSTAQRLLFTGTLSFLLAHIAEQSALCSLEKDRPDTDFCAVLRYINEHFDEDVSLGALSARFGYSPPYFSRIFHRYMNINLTEYVNLARVRRARELLESHGTVAEIAFACGFRSLPSFYRAYKKAFGTLPRG